MIGYPGPHPVLCGTSTCSHCPGSHITVQPHYVLPDWTARTIYRRRKARWFWISQMAGIIRMLINGTILIRYRKYLSKRIDRTGRSHSAARHGHGPGVRIRHSSSSPLYCHHGFSLCIYISIQVEQSRKFSQGRTGTGEKPHSHHAVPNPPPFSAQPPPSVNIKGLCQTDPGKAELAVDHFSGFLRGTWDSPPPVSFHTVQPGTVPYTALSGTGADALGSRLNVIL